MARTAKPFTVVHHTRSLRVQKRSTTTIENMNAEALALLKCQTMQNAWQNAVKNHWPASAVAALKTQAQTCHPDRIDLGDVVSRGPFGSEAAKTKRVLFLQQYNQILTRVAQHGPGGLDPASLETLARELEKLQLAVEAKTIRNLIVAPGGGPLAAPMQISSSASTSAAGSDYGVVFIMKPKYFKIEESSTVLDFVFAVAKLGFAIFGTPALAGVFQGAEAAIAAVPEAEKAIATGRYIITTIQQYQRFLGVSPIDLPTNIPAAERLAISSFQEAFKNISPSTVDKFWMVPHGWPLRIKLWGTPCSDEEVKTGICGLPSPPGTLPSSLMINIPRSDDPEDLWAYVEFLQPGLGGGELARAVGFVRMSRISLAMEYL